MEKATLDVKVLVRNEGFDALISFESATGDYSLRVPDSKLNKPLEVTEEIVEIFKAAWNEADNKGLPNRSQHALEEVFAFLAEGLVE